MPRIQVLPYVPSFIEGISPALQQAAAAVGSGISQKRARTALNKMLQPQGNVASGSGVDQMSQVAQQNENNNEINPLKLIQMQKLVEQAYGPEAGRVFTNASIEQQKLASKEAMQSRKEDTEAYKITQDYRSKLLDSYEGAKRTEMQLSRLKELNQQDKLTTPAMAKISESLGIPLSIVANPESEEFQKLSQDLMSNITKYFGNRILQVEVENFLKTIPTLMNSKEGRERIIENMELLQQAPKLAYESYKDIRKKGGRVPLDLQERVLEKMEPELDKIAEKFRKGSDAITAPTSSKEAENFVIVTSPDGTKHWVPKSKASDAIKAGGKIE